jgi:two-component system OmpR family response regulator
MQLRESRRAPAESRSVLLADDEESILFALGGYLRGRGYAVTTAATRIAAEAELERSPFDAVITDLSFGDGDPHGGIAIVRAARRRCEKAIILILTAYGSPDVESEAQALGVAGVMTKPIPLANLAATLTSLLEVQR